MGSISLVGIKGHQYKDFRHSFAVRCLQCGCDYLTLAKLLGADSIENLVKTYKGFVKENPRKYMEKIMDECVAFPISETNEIRVTEWIVNVVMISQMP